MEEDVFELVFGTEGQARSAARDTRNRGFTVDVRPTPAGEWSTFNRLRSGIPLEERGRYLHRLATIAASHDGPVVNA